MRELPLSERPKITEAILDKLPPGIARSVYPKDKPPTQNEWMQYIHDLSNKYKDIHKQLK